MQRSRENAIRISSFGRTALVFLAIPVALVLSWSSIRAALATHYAGLQTLAGYQKAVELEPKDSEKWYLLGRYWELNMDSPDLERAADAYRKALRFSPESTEAELALGGVLESQGDLTGAREAFRTALQYYPTSAEVSWRFGSFLLRQGDLTEAYRQLHNAVVADPNKGVEVFNACFKAGGDFERILLDVLPPNPRVLLNVNWELINKNELGLALIVWKRVVTLKGQPLKQDVDFLARGLLTHGRIDEARSVWLEGVQLMGYSMPPNTEGSLVWDGGFETDLTDVAFGWYLRGASGAFVHFDANVRHTGQRSLRIDFDGSRDADVGSLCQTIVVAPDTNYGLSAWVRSLRLRPESGLAIELRSPSPDGVSVAVGALTDGSGQWTRLSMPWKSSPMQRVAEVCISRRHNGEKPNGTIWIDDVSLVPEPLAPKG